MTHAPRRLVRHGKLALQFLRRDAMPGRGEQIHGVEPLHQWRSGTLKGCTRHWADVITAPLALVKRAVFTLVKLAVFPAAGAVYWVAMAGIHQAFKASVVIWEHLKKLQYTHRLSHSLILHDYNTSLFEYRSQGDNYQILIPEIFSDPIIS